ncbi:choice-of-anchor D domain-containing protein [Kribbella sp. NPDC051587]|uniref:choice-of-anchor D domain-containing protein n=1 Tax=Kribbella sp. NPDC051587 TaxID=3364119 RepID=UPI0037A144FC
MSRLPRVPTALITTAALLAAGIAVVTITRGASAADQRPASVGLVSDPATMGPSSRSTVSSNGKWVAFEAPKGETQSIWLRDINNIGSLQVLPGIEDLTAITPTMSGDAGLIAFAGGRFGGTLSDPLQDGQFYALNRRDPDHTVLKQVTGGAGDLPYQRMVPCGSDADDCAPKLSRDGTTLVAPVQQSIETSVLEMTVDGRGIGTDRGLYPVLDFGAFSTSGESTVTLKNIGQLPIIYPDTGPVLEGDAQFTVASSTCAGVLAKDASCSVKVTFTGGPDCTAEANGVLRFPATAAPGQTAIKVTGGGECPRLAALQPRAAAAAATPDCTGPSQNAGYLPNAVEPRPGDDGHPQPWFPLDSVNAGELDIAALTIHNSMSVPLVPRLTSPGCHLKLVLPANASADACRPGRPVAPQTSCTAYVEYNLPEVAPFSGSIHLGDTVYRIGGHAARNVIAAWRDASASGNFGPARIVSVTSGANGVPMAGDGPTVSADGRWVAYNSITPYSRPVPLVGWYSQVYRHDTDSGGDRTYTPGETTLASVLGSGGLPRSTHSPSISDDGTRVSFTDDRDSPDQVFVRDIPAQKTVLASAGPEGTQGGRSSGNAVLSGDGYTVAYVSEADLGAGSLAGERIIGRDLTKDFAGGRGTNELLSPRPDSAPGSGDSDAFIALSQDGTQATFASTDQLDKFNDADNEADLYHSRRSGHVTTTPDPVDFGTAKVGTSAGPVPMTVTNDGTTAVQLDKPVLIGDEFSAADDQCVGTVIRPGRSCAFLLRFTPKVIGLREGHVYAHSIGGASVNSGSADLTGRGSSDVKMPGETKHVSTNSAEHRDPAISDSGQLVAYRTRTSTGDSSYNQINVRDQANADVKLIGQHDEVGPPSISGDGSRVAYAATDLGEAASATNVMVAAGSTKRRITGTTTDLRYQRPCATDHLDSSCKPDISGDGKTVAFGAKLDARADWQLKPILKEFDGSLHPVESLIDLSTGGTKTLQVGTSRAIHFNEKPSIDPGSAFSVTATTCEGDLQAGASCTVDIRFDACGGAHNGVLRLNGSTPEGQAAIALTANNICVHLRDQPTPRAAADCTPIPQPGYTPAISTGTTSAGNILGDAGDVEVGGTAYVAVSVPAKAGVQDISFVSGCDLALVTPTTTDPNRPRPCVNGERLPANTGCTAIVGYRPTAVDPASAYLTTQTNADEKSYRFVGTGTRTVVLTRTDTAGDGTFAGAPEIVSVDAAGAVTFGQQPSVSADGRYVAFAGIYGLDDPQAASLQVYRRDRTTGTTILASQLADGAVGTDNALYPSLSASGNRVAFETEGESGPGLAARKGTAAGRAEQADAHPSRVWARDLSSAKTILVSAAAGKPTEEGDGWSSSASISADGTTVGFDSQADDLVEQPGNSNRGVYVRSIDPDFAGAPVSERFSERVSLTEDGSVAEDGDSQSPSLSADGAFTAFESRSDLVAGTVDDGLVDIFTRRRTAQLVATPTAADFGAVQVGKSSSAREMVVKNIGYGPAAAGPAAAAAPFVAGSNVCAQTLHRGQSCAVDARFAPTAVGPATGTLTLPSKSGYLAGPSAAVGLTGNGTPVPPVARFAVTPLSVTFPAVEVGKASSPQAVKLQNTGDVPLNVAATAKGADFGITLGSCTTVMPRATCDVPVTFAPRATGGRTGSIMVTPTSADPAVASPAAVTVGLSGSGTPGTAVASMTVAPQGLVFGPQVLTVPSAPKSIVVTNTGTVPLTLSGVSSVPDFRTAVGCAPLQPGKTCVIAVRFAPQLLGARTGVVQVSATSAGAVAPFPVPVKVSGTTLTPTLLVDPPVARPGQIVLATGTNFPPGRPAVLGWDLGLGGQPAIADKTGKFVAPVLVYRRDVLGQRVMTATVSGLNSSSGRPLPVKSQPVLVMPLSYQPPDFVLRW